MSLAIAAHAPTAFGQSGASATSRLTFGNCTFEAGRYFSCTTADPKVKAWLQTKPGVHPGVAFTEFLKAYFEAQGCSYGVVNEAFRINGVFFSFDTREFSNIACARQSPKPAFSPNKAVAFGIIDFWFEDPPQ